MSVPPNSIYSKLLEGYFGNLYPSDQDALWQEFKTENGFTTNPADNDTSALSEFVSFIQSTYSTETTSTILSPDAVTQRQVIMNVYEALIAMMESMQTTSGVIGNNLVYLSRFQQSYTDMMTQEASNIYIGGSPETANVDINDLTQWTLGYGNLTMANYLSTAIATMPNTTSSSEIVSVPNDGVVTLPTGTVYINPPLPSNAQVTALEGGTANVQSGGNIVISSAGATVSSLSGGTSLTISSGPLTLNSDSGATLTFSGTPTSVTITYTSPPIILPNETLPATFVLSQTANYSASMTATQKLQLATQAFTTLYNTDVGNTGMTVGDYINNSADQIFIPWGQITTSVNSSTTTLDINQSTPLGLDPTSSQGVIDAAASQARLTKNQLLQQYIQNATTQRDVLKNQYDSVQTNLSSAQSGISSADNILQSTIQSLNDILNSIFSLS